MSISNSLGTVLGAIRDVRACGAVTGAVTEAQEEAADEVDAALD